MQRLLPLLLVPVLSTSVWAQAPSEIRNPDAILKELESIEQTQAQTRRAKLSELHQSFQNASRSGAPASSLYSDAIQATRFAGRAGGGGEYSEWRKNNASTLRAREVNTALQYHFRYLAILMALEMTEDQEAAAAASLQYARDLAADNSVVPSGQLAKEMQPFVKELLEASLAASPIAKHLYFEQYLDKSKNLEMTPGNVPGILSKNVRPYLREAKNPALIETWNVEINYEQAKAKDARVAHRMETFETVNLPRLVFNRAKDAAVVGQNAQALNEMMQLIRQYPEHPDRAIWIQQAKDVVSKAMQAPEAELQPAEPEPAAETPATAP